MSLSGPAARALIGTILLAALAFQPATAGRGRGMVAASLAPPWDHSAAPPIAEGSEVIRPDGQDQPDAEPDKNQTHVVYFVPKDRPDEQLDTNGTLTKSIDSIRSWFARETSRNGAAKRPRIDRLLTGEYDITFIRGDQDAAFYTSLGTIVDELVRKQHAATNKRYLVYAAVARGTTCGQGYYPLPVPGLDNGRYAAIYLDSNTGCGARDFGGGSAASAGKAETIAVQEWLHNEAIVSPLSPHHCPTQPFHVCTGPLVYLPDLLDPESVDAAFPFVTHQLRDKVLDRDHDDYFDHAWSHVPNLRDSTWLE